jgi:hypothetical protein
MRKLESMIAQFVDDLLHTIGEATIEELRELFATVPERSEGEPLFPSAELTPAAPSRPARATRAPRVDQAAARRSIATLANVRSASSLPPPAVAEITDPESLLSIVATNGSAPAIGSVRRSAPSILTPVPTRTATATTERAQETEGESPASGVRPVGGSTVRLSDNETLARVSNSGVVIRRKKKA